MATETTKTTDILDPMLLSDPIGYITKNQEIIFNFSWNIIYAIIILAIGYILAKIISSVTYKLMTKACIEMTISHFIANIIKYTFIIFFIIAALSQIGIQTASFIAILGAASFAVGMSLQGSLSNFASGILLLIFRPIKVGELVEVAGKTGTIEEITIFTTTMLSADNKMVVIPNNNISSSVITNYSRMPVRRVDFTFGVEYGSDLKKAKEVLTQMFEEDSRVLKDKGITVIIGALNSSSINIVCRVWAKTEDYWGVYNDNLEKSVEVLTKANIGIPYTTYTIINKQ